MATRGVRDVKENRSAWPLPLPDAIPLEVALERTLAIGAKRGQNLTHVRDALRQALRPSRLARLEALHASSYRTNRPFPHTVIDNLLPAAVLQSVNAELPEGYYLPTETKRNQGCSKLLRSGQAHSFYCANIKGREERKSGLQHDDDMGPATVMAFHALKSAEFTAFLERLSGVERPLYPDPEYLGTGVHMVAPGGMLGLHADFNVYRKFGVARRVNTFLYLNKDWPNSYGGHLELWNKDKTRCE